MSIKSKKYGIFGGSFDPIHNGHLTVAAYALEALELDFIYIIPAFNPPHKERVKASFNKRVEWLRKAFTSEKRAVISTYEAEKGGPSYTIDTVRHFSKKHGTPPYLILGEDSLKNIKSWYRFQELLKEAFIVVYPRYKRRASYAYDSLKSYEKRGIIFLNAPLIQLSATEIRHRVETKKSILGMVPESILLEVIAFYERNF